MVPWAMAVAVVIAGMCALDVQAGDTGKAGKAGKLSTSHHRPHPRCLATCDRARFQAIPLSFSAASWPPVTACPSALPQATCAMCACRSQRHIDGSSAAQSILPTLTEYLYLCARASDATMPIHTHPPTHTSPTPIGAFTCVALLLHEACMHVVGVAWNGGQGCGVSSSMHACIRCARASVLI
jgi:hypothetical protein